MLSWVRGRAAYSELSPLDRAIAILVIGGMFAALSAWLVFASHSASVALRPLVERSRSDVSEDKPMKRTEAVNITGAQLFTAEKAVSHAIRETSRLAITMIDVREEAGFSATVGGQALNHLGVSLAALFSSHAAMVETHAELDAVKTRIGCRTVSGGGMEKDDPEQAIAATAGSPIGLVRVAA